MRYRCETMQLETLEEAPTGFAAWMAQRTRWMKGWMQTFIVHNRQPGKLLAEMGAWNMLVFEITVLGMIIAPLLHAGFLLIIAARLALALPILPDTQWHWSALYIALLTLGYGAAIALPLAGLERQKRSHLFIGQIGLPLYWLLMALATMRALHELIDKPFHWAKTQHRIVGRDRSGSRWRSSRVSRLWKSKRPAQNKPRNQS